MKEKIGLQVLSVIFITFILVYLMSYILTSILTVILGISVLIGFGYALYHYGLSLRNNIKSN